jgi:hypothetical protein
LVCRTHEKGIGKDRGRGEKMITVKQATIDDIPIIEDILHGHLA